MTNPQIGPSLAQSIKNQSGQFGIPAPLIEALAVVESSGRWHAIRHEPNYRYLWDVAAKRPFRKLAKEETFAARAPAGFVVPRGWPSNADTEWMGQRTSWGPLQVMGSVAREYGSTTEFPQLCSDLGLYYACKHMDRLRARWFGAHGWAGVVAAYNAGSPQIGVAGKFANQGYVDKVLAALGFPFSRL